MSFTIVLWGILLTIFVGAPSLYYFYMKRFSFRPWNVKKDENYIPPVTILVPVYNEERIIRFKMENLMKLDYPKDKLHVIIVNDGSTDRTLQRVSEFLKTKALSIRIEVLDSIQRRGKTNSLNLALKHANGEVIVVSDADCFWSPDTLRKALSFLSDPKVGAVTGLENLLNPEGSWVTRTEFLYNNTVHTLRVGESKFHSTIFFQGGFGAYKRSVLEQFDVEADDSGTALNIIQKGARTLLLPEATYFTVFPSEWRGKIGIKLRRASQLVRIWVRCLKLSLRGKLLLPKRVFIPEAFLYLVNPFIFLLFVASSILLVLERPLFLLFFAVFLVGCFVVKPARILLVEAIQDHLVLLGAILSLVFGESFTVWSTAGVSRTWLSREMLQSHGLV